MPKFTNVSQLTVGLEREVTIDVDHSHGTWARDEDGEWAPVGEHVVWPGTVETVETVEPGEEVNLTKARQEVEPNSILIEKGILCPS